MYREVRDPGRRLAGRDEAASLSWALLFLLVALAAALLGFGQLVAATGVAKGVFFIFFALFLVSLLAHAYRPLTR